MPSSCFGVKSVKQPSVLPIFVSYQQKWEDVTWQESIFQRKVREDAAFAELCWGFTCVLIR